MIEFENVFYNYPDGTEALKGIEYRIEKGEKVALVGPNGSGKSTLLLHTNGILLPTSGAVKVNGQPITQKKPKRGQKGRRTNISRLR
jgi:cobalt/nickel transport system ATP-binding protein